MKYTCQMYCSGGYQAPLDEPMPNGTPYAIWTAADGTKQINFLIPHTWLKQPWPETFIDGYWSGSAE